MHPRHVQMLICILIPGDLDPGQQHLTFRYSQKSTNTHSKITLTITTTITITTMMMRESMFPWQKMKLLQESRNIKFPWFSFFKFPSKTKISNNEIGVGK